MLRYLLLAIVPIVLFAQNGLALNAGDFLRYPVKVKPKFYDRWISDRFVLYTREGVHVPANLLMMFSLKVCVDFSKESCTTTYDNFEAVQKAVKLRYATAVLPQNRQDDRDPLLSITEIIDLGIRNSIEDKTFTTTSSWVMMSDSLRLNVRMRETDNRTGQVKTMTTHVDFVIDERFGDLEMEFVDVVRDRPFLQRPSQLSQDHHKDYAESVVRIISNFNDSNGVARAQSSTGFFFKNRNYLVTNWHGLEDNPDCRFNRRCLLQFTHTDRNSRVRSFNSNANVLYVNEEEDIAFIEVSTPQSIPARILGLNKSSVSSGLILLGYPVTSIVSNELIFSYGFLNGSVEKCHCLLASTYSSVGFSGGPIVGQGGQIVGLLVKQTFPLGYDNEFGASRFIPIGHVESLIRSRLGTSLDRLALN